MRLGDWSSGRGAGKGPTITFAEACTKYGYTKGKLQQLLREHNGPKPALKASPTGGGRDNSLKRKGATYYNAAEFDKWIRGLKCDNTQG